MDLLEKHFTLYGNTPDHICYRTFKRLFQELEKRGWPPLTILETGTAAYGTYSTYLFDAYVRRFGGHFWTVDIKQEHSDKVKPHMSQQTTVVTDDSVKFLQQWVAEHPGQQADLVYLDSYDLDFDDPYASGDHGLAEYNAILPALKTGSLLLVDDTPAMTDELLEEHPQLFLAVARTYDRLHVCPGKGMYILQHCKAQLLRHYYQLLYAF